MHGILNRISQTECTHDLGNRLNQIDRQKYQQDIADHLKMNAGARRTGGQPCHVRGQPAGNHAFDPRSGRNRCNTYHNHKN